MNLKAKHVIVLAMIIGGLGTMLLGVKGGWADVLTPTSVGGLLVALSGGIQAMFVDKPRNPESRGRATDRRNYERI